MPVLVLLIGCDPPAVSVGEGERPVVRLLPGRSGLQRLRAAGSGGPDRLVEVYSDRLHRVSGDRTLFAWKPGSEVHGVLFGGRRATASLLMYPIYCLVPQQSGYVVGEAAAASGEGDQDAGTSCPAGRCLLHDPRIRRGCGTNSGARANQRPVRRRGPLDICRSQESMCSLALGRLARHACRLLQPAHGGGRRSAPC